MKYGLVLGQGRSGTNWMVDTLDASPRTFCRNEPNEGSQAAMHELPNHWLIGSGADELADRWDDVARLTATTMGERDHRINHPKTYVYPTAQKLGVAQASARPQMRSALSKVVRSWSEGEWSMPKWVGQSPDQADVVAVFKLVQTFNWAAWVLENRPDVPVVHVVRHPAARHDSFLRRYIGESDPEPTRRAKVDQLAELAAVDSVWAERMGDVEAMDLAEAETWFGIYQSEELERTASGSPRYLRIVYEEMVEDPVTAAAHAFYHFGLELTPDIRALVEADSTTSVWGSVTTSPSDKTSGWRDRLDPDAQRRIQAILDTSWTSQWWDERAEYPQAA